MGLSGTERQAAFDAVSEWENEYAFPFNEFQHACGSDTLQFYHNEGPWPGWDQACLDVWTGCFRVTMEYHDDQLRQGYYITNRQVWLNTRDYDFTYRGALGQLVHELGHVYGQGDMYIHEGGNDYSCNEVLTTIMNASVVVPGTNPPLVDGICNPGPGAPLDSVQAWDHTKSHYFNVMNVADFQHQNVNAFQHQSTSQMLILFDDHAPAEQRYRINMQRWMPGWETQTSFLFYDDIAYGDMHWWNQLATLWDKWFWPDGFWRACPELYSKVTGYRYEKCSNFVYLD